MKIESRPSRALIAYSVLAERLKSNGATYFQALMPFLVMACREFSGEMYDAAKFARSVNDLYGIKIPQLMALGLANQLYDEGYLEKLSSGRTEVFKYTDKVSCVDDGVTDVTEAQVNDVITSFVSYVETNGRGLRKDRGYLEEAFFSRLLNIDSMRIISRKEYRVGLKVDKTTIIIDASKGGVENNDELHLDVLVSDFLMEISDKKSDLFDLISNVSFANMAAETLTCFSSPPEKNESLRDVTIYLDTPLILDILGVNSEYSDYGAELLALLKDSGSKIYVMDHCVSEAESAISSQYESMMTGISKRSNSLSGSIKPEVLSALKGRVSERAFSYGITHVADPIINLHKRNERATGTLQTAIQNKMITWGNDEAKRHDEKSVLSVIAIRNSTVPIKKLSECGVVFVTRNSALVSIANSAWAAWLKDTTSHGEHARANWAPIALSDKQFAGFIWMMRGGVSSIPRSRLLAHCASALRPRNDVKARAYNLILDTHGKQEADHFAALVSERDSGRALMRATAGNPLDVTIDRLPYIMDVVLREAGEYAAAHERQMAEERRLLLIEEHSREIEMIAGRSESLDAKNRELLLQSDIDMQKQVVKAKALAEQLQDIQTKEKARINSILKEGFDSGCREFRMARIFFVLIFILVTLLVMNFPDFPAITKILTAGLAGLGFWFVPGVLDIPARWLANRRMIRVVRARDVDIPDHKPDFEGRLWSALEG